MNDAKLSWSHRSTFILAAAGSAIGLGNIWKFPYMAGESGGGAFVLIYLVCIALIGLPIMISEIIIGRHAHANSVDAIQSAARESGGSSYWQAIAFIGFLCLFLLFSFYSVIAGWALDYTLNFSLGSFTGKSKEDVSSFFDAMLASPMRLTFWHTVFTLLTAGIIMAGAIKGIQRAIQVLMPLLVVLLIVMLIYSVTQTGQFAKGFSYMFHWEPERLKDPDIIISALGHAFFSLSLGMCVIMTYASYLPKGISITESALWITAIDTGVALTAGLVIFPIVFANGLETGSGPGLLFVTLSTAFADLGIIGGILGALFFLLVSVAALSSSISMVEPVVKWVTERFQMSRKVFTLYYCGATWVFGLVTVLSFNLWSGVHLLGGKKTPFDLIDYFASNILLPLGGLLVAVFTGWVVSKELAKRELIELNGNLVFQAWHFVTKYIAPVCILLIFYSVIFK